MTKLENEIPELRKFAPATELFSSKFCNDTCSCLQLPFPYGDADTEVNVQSSAPAAPGAQSPVYTVMFPLLSITGVKARAVPVFRKGKDGYRFVSGRFKGCSVDDRFRVSSLNCESEVVEGRKI